MKRWHQYLTAAAGLGLITVVLSTTTARAAVAQPGQSPLEAVLDAITALGTSLSSTLSNIQSSLDTLTAPGQSQVRVTPVFVINPGGSGTCAVLNVSDVALTLAIDVLRLNGQQTGGHSQLVQPGAGYFLGVTSSLTDRTASYCKFTVEDGSKADIRAAAEVYEPGPNPLNAVAAIVAAE